MLAKETPVRLLPRIFPRNLETHAADLERSLIRMEAKLGGELFGAVPNGHRREFFCLDEHTWVWHEEWVDSKGHRRVTTTRYDVRPSGVLKSQSGQAYQTLSKEEARNLYQTTELYCQRVGAQYQRMLQSA